MRRYYSSELREFFFFVLSVHESARANSEFSAGTRNLGRDCWADSRLSAWLCVCVCVRACLCVNYIYVGIYVGIYSGVYIGIYIGI
jgi:hypothetical protein